MCKVNPIQPAAQVKNNLKRSSTDNFQNILETKEKEFEIDTDQVYDKNTCEVIEDLDNLSTDTLKNLLREE